MKSGVIKETRYFQEMENATRQPSAGRIRAAFWITPGIKPKSINHFVKPAFQLAGMI